MEMNSVDEFFASIEEECVSTIHPLQLTPEEQESTKQNLYCCLLEKLSFNLFACLEKETGVGLFDLKSIITSINIINIDYLLLITCRFCAESVAHRRLETCLVGFINQLVTQFSLPHIVENLRLLVSSENGSNDIKPIAVDNLLELLCDRFHHDLRKGQAAISNFGIVILSSILKNNLVSAYELVQHLCFSLLMALPKCNQSWNCSQRSVTKSKLDIVVTALSQVIQLQFIVAVLDTLGRESSKQDMLRHFQSSMDDCTLNQELMEQLVANGRKFILSFRSLIPTISYTVRAVLLHTSVFVRPDLAYMILQNGYKVDWDAYLSTVQDLENSWNALIYARRHSKVDLWKSIDPDWKDKGYQYVYLVSREETYAILKNKDPGTFMLIPQDLECEFCTQMVLTYRTAGSEQYKNAIVRRERNEAWESSQSENNSNKESTEPKYFYRCGKYGPNGNLYQTLKDLSAIIPGSLRLDIILPPSLPLPGNDLFVPKLDLNMHLWLDIQQAMPRWIQTVNVGRQTFNIPSGGDSQPCECAPIFASFPSQKNGKSHVFVDDLLQHEESDIEEDEDDYSDDNDDDDRATSASGDTAYTSEEDNPDDREALDSPGRRIVGTPVNMDPKRKLSVAASVVAGKKKRSTHPAWSAFDPEYIEYLNHTLVAMKAVMRFAEQSTSVCVLIEKLFTLDIDNMRTVYSEDDIEHVQHCADHLYASIQQQFAVPFAESLLRVLLLANGDEDERYDAVHSNVVLSLLLPMLCYVEDSDELLRQQILPSSPPGLAVAPSLKFLPPYDQISSTFLYKATKNYYSRELYLLEKLLQYMLESVRLKALRVPERLNGFGLTESIVPDCIAATDVILLVTKWREMLLQSAAAKLAAAMTAVSTATKSYVTKKPLFFLSPNAAAEDEDDEDDSFYITTSPRKPTAMDSKYEKDIAYTKRDWQAARTFGNIMQLLSVDINLEPSELMHKLIYWMFSCKAIQEITKPAETAFSIPQIYYHYVDHWESRVLGDPNALNDRVQLGRQFFSDAQTVSVNDSYNWKKENLFTLSRDALDNDFYCPYSKRIAAVLRASEIMQEVNRSKQQPLSTGMIPSSSAKATTTTRSSRSYSKKTRRISRATSPLSTTPMRSLSTVPPPASQFGPDSYQARNERHQDWTYHFLQLYELLQVEEYIKKMIAHCHLYHLDVEQYHEKLRGSSNIATSHAPAPSISPATASSVSSSPVPVLPFTAGQYPSSHFPSNKTTPRSPAYNSLLDPTNTPLSSALWQGSALGQSSYVTTLNQFLYKNALFARLLMPYRYVALVQVDLYSLKEILGVTPRTSTGTSTASGLPNHGSSGNLSSLGGSSSESHHQSNSKPPSVNNLASFFGVASGTGPTTSHSIQQRNPTGHSALLSTSLSAGTHTAMAHAASTPSSSATIVSSATATATVNASTQKVYGANMGQSVTANTLTIVPSTTLHNVHSMDVYAVIRLVKTSIDSRNSRDGTGLMNIFPTSKVHVDGSCITPVTKAEPLSSGGGGQYSGNASNHLLPPKPKVQSTGNTSGMNAAAGGAAAGVGAGGGGAKRGASGGKYSRQILAQVSAAVDFEWRTQGIFRFALPEGWLTLIQEELALNMEGGNIGRQDIRSPPALKIHITLYERNFFTDSVLGEVHIPLEDLTEKNAIRDWFPIVHDKSVSWLLFAQAKLRFQLMKTELPVVGAGLPHHAMTMTSSPLTTSSSAAAGMVSAGKAAFSAAPTAAAAAITDAIGALKHNKRFEAFANLADRFRPPIDRSTAALSMASSSMPGISSEGKPSTTTTTTNPPSKLVIAAPSKPSFHLDLLLDNKGEETKESNPTRFAKKIVMKKPANFIEDLLNS